MSVTERLIRQRRYQGVPEGIGEHYWHDAGVKGYWGVIKPYGYEIVNVALNPSMEIGFSTIYNRYQALSGATVLRNEEGAIYGNFGVQVITNAVNQGIKYDLFPQFTFDTPYSACIGVDGPAGAVVSFRFEYPTGSPTVTFSVPTVVTLPGYPIRICSRMMPVPPDANPVIPTIPIALRFDRAGEYRVDGLVLTTTEEPITGYFDGDSPDGTWTGIPHLSSSTMSPLSRSFGEPVDFNEIGFNITGATGFGVTPKQLLTTSYARLNGAHYQRTKDAPRVITLTGTFEGVPAVGAPAEMHEARNALIDALSWRFEDQCTKEMILTYCLRDECGCQVSPQVQIPVAYQAGLEGLWGSLDRERATLVFVANTEQSFSDEFPSSVDLDINGAKVIDYQGTAPAWVELHMHPGETTTNVTEIHNDTTGHSVYFGYPGGNPTALPLQYTATTQEYAILRTDPQKRLSLDLFTSTYSGGVYQGTVQSRIMHYIRYQISQVGLFRLVPGENQIRVFAQNISGARIFLTWRNRYKSVDHLQACGCVESA